MTIDSDEMIDEQILDPGGATVASVAVGATLPARLWRELGGAGEQVGAVTARTLNLWGDESALLGRVLKGYLGDLRAEIPATDDPTMRRDLREEEELVRNILDRLP